MPQKLARLLYGEGTVDVALPEWVHTLEMKPLAPLTEAGAAVKEALQHPIQSPALLDLARGRESACVVVSDVTRPVPNRVILPPILETLAEAGIGRERVTLLIATGMHRPNLGEELAAVLGPEIAERYTVINHYCRRPEEYRKVDEIDGAPIEINRHYLDADLKILTGLIEPHFYAGYSGGRKAILPGISSFETMKFMHSYRMIAHPNVTNCLLDGNPFHQYGLRVAERVGADFIVNVVINRERLPAGVFAGHYHHAHVAGCDMISRHSVVEIDQAVDLVITSGGGYPLDATFYQISKALICARDILRPGGTIVVACECREGLGSPEFCGVLRGVCSFQEFSSRHCDPQNFVIDQWCAQNIYQALDHAGRVYVFCPTLADADLRNMGAFKIADPQRTVDALLEAHPVSVVVPDGPYVVGRVRGKRARPP
jgi:nickel-dependent lactate racemase